MKVLVTGVAGFIGSFLAERLVKRGDEVVGLDNLNAYYPVSLKLDRLKRLGIKEVKASAFVTSTIYANLRFIQMDLADREGIAQLFADEQFDAVCNLAAQAGVRYSIENPEAYIQSNIVGFLHILEGCRQNQVKHLVYASSSSVYGLNKQIPFKETDQVDQPVSLYGATKKADELMAFSYSQLYGLPTTGLRYFTVYGPWGRPDMVPNLFLKEILGEGTIQVFNHGDLQRDFTYIADVIDATLRVLDFPSEESIPYKIYNVGNSSPVALMDFIRLLESYAGKTVNKVFKEMQPGDVKSTYADTSKLEHDVHYKPKTSVEEGTRMFYEWFVTYYNIK